MMPSSTSPYSSSSGSSNPQTNLKVLLMGRAGAGKTSMRSIVFANYLARDTKRLTATTNVEHSHLRFLGNLVLSLWDCGGQDTFMENYFESQREQIFRNAEVLIYVVEARTGAGVFPNQQLQQSAALKIREIEKDFKYFKTTADSIKQFSPNARVFCFVHKMDLVKPGQRCSIVDDYTEELKRLSEGLQMKVFGTSIWDATLYEAWSEIANSLLPKQCVELLDGYLKKFCDVVGADEVVLFEKSTFLVISRATKMRHPDMHRFEKISNLCKQFKLTCLKNQSNFSNFTVQVNSFSCFMERFTLNTYILLLVSDKEIPPSSVLCNVDYARVAVERLTETMKLGPSL